MTGIVTKIFLEEGFGFVRGSDRVSRFFHVKDVEPQIMFSYMHEGQKVSFTSKDMGEQNPAMKKGNGLRAVQVTPLEE